MTPNLQTLDAQVRHYGAIRHRLFNQSPPKTKRRRHRTVNVPSSTPAPVEAVLLPVIVKAARHHVRDWIVVTEKPKWEPPSGAAKDIFTEICLRRGVHPRDVMGRTRPRKLVACRAKIYVRLKRDLGWCLPQIGKFLGGRDHTTVLHAIKQWEAGRYA
jgi:hypothetical protein